MSSEDKLLGTQEVLGKLKISRKTLYALMGRGVIQPIDNKRSYLTKHPKLLFRSSDVERLLDGETADDKESHAA